MSEHSHTFSMGITSRQFEIIQASGKILINKGVTGLTIKALAAEMGFVESALYRHFKSKEDILILMIQYLQQNVQDRIEPIAHSDENPVQKIKMIFESQFRFLNENRHFVIAMMSEGLLDESDGIKNEAIKLFLYKMPIIYRLLTEGIEQQLITPIISTEAMLHFLIGGFRTLIFRWKMTGFLLDVEKVGNQMVEDFFTLIKQNTK
ncbi:MAG: TetR/AcrR family transcriptional regulator [Saprospiraceae bacterium]|nr:TetR/AcrR family transcriptional regulator [Saprospiraceae bacterium]MBK9567915.1 TetR/AcrR family transcriptional regulator [Saprospiraceae bacterium]MBP6445819.1 TetR/AcrR family transcriptional regulator [Saprospiraceae bacterium]